MNSSEKDTKTVRVPIFNGKLEAFQTQWVRFRAYAKLGGFLKAISESPEPDLPNNQNEADNPTGTDEEIKKMKAAVDRNDSAMASLTLAFETDELIAMILSVQSTDWPEGLASDVIKKLKNKYKPQDIMSLVDKKVELNKIKMKATDDPKVLFDQITAVETRFQTKTHQIKEEDKIAIILSQAPMKYKTVLTNE